jgi:hypothetical protein
MRTVRLGNLTFIVHGKSSIENKTVGKGCKRTPAWETHSTKEEISKKIDEFWDTRIEGNPEVWSVLRAACLEPQPTTAEQIVKSSGLSMLSGSLMLTFDEQGYRYDLPVYVINEAVKYGSEKIPSKLPDNFKGDDIEITLRCARFKDESFKINTSSNCRIVKEMYSEKFCLPVDRIRMFFNGKELRNDGFLHQYKVTDGVVLQVVAQNS